MTIEQALSLALSIVQSLGLMVFIQAFVVIALVGGFIAIVTSRK